MSLNVNIRGIEEAIRNLTGVFSDQRVRELCRRLAEYGLVLADASFSGAAYDGRRDVTVSIEENGNGYRIVAAGVSVLFIEFGAGVTLGYGHPLAGAMGYGPGTYPGHGNWDNPNGWYIPRSKGGGHTYGNPPSMSMYNTARDLQSEIANIAREVFAT